MLYTRRPEEKLARLGLRPDDFNQDVLVWPEVWPILTLLQAMSMQWDIHVGRERPVYIKLDYTALPLIAQAHRIELTADTLSLLRHAERTARHCLNS